MGQVAPASSLRINWFLYPSGTWHAWPHGGNRTLCGMLSVDDLKRRPALRINGSGLTEEEQLAACDTCRDSLGIGPTTKPDEHLSPNARKWFALLARYLQSEHLPVTKYRRSLEMFAAKLAVLGSPADPVTQGAFIQLRDLLLNPYRIRSHAADGSNRTRATFPRLTAAVERLPDDAAGLRHVATALLVLREVTGRTPTRQKYRPDDVVQTICQIARPDSYVRILHRQGTAPYVSAYFSVEALQRAKRNTALRGLFGTDASSVSLPDFTVVE